MKQNIFLKFIEDYALRGETEADTICGSSYIYKINSENTWNAADRSIISRRQNEAYINTNKQKNHKKLSHIFHNFQGFQSLCRWKNSNEATNTMLAMKILTHQNDKTIKQKNIEALKTFFSFSCEILCWWGADLRFLLKGIPKKTFLRSTQ